MRHHRSVAEATTEPCPGCGGVLVALTGDLPRYPGASTSCRRLFTDTLRGLRDEAPADAGVAATVRLADAAYAAQHPVVDAPARWAAARRTLAELLHDPVVPAGGAPRPLAWRTTIVDVAADLDVIDLRVLVESWARTVLEDWAAPVTARP